MNTNQLFARINVGRAHGDWVQQTSTFKDSSSSDTKMTWESVGHAPVENGGISSGSTASAYSITNTSNCNANGQTSKYMPPQEILTIDTDLYLAVNRKRKLFNLADEDSMDVDVDAPLQKLRPIASNSKITFASTRHASRTLTLKGQHKKEQREKDTITAATSIARDHFWSGKLRYINKQARIVTLEDYFFFVVHRPEFRHILSGASDSAKSQIIDGVANILLNHLRPLADTGAVISHGEVIRQYLDVLLHLGVQYKKTKLFKLGEKLDIDGKDEHWDF